MLVLLSSHAPKSYLLTEEYAQSGLLFKQFYLVAACLGKLVTLVLGFTAMECNFIACGQGYRPEKKTKKPDGEEITEAENFNAIRNVDCGPIFACTDFGALVNAWNISIHHWLKYYVMMRLIDRTKPKNQTQVMPQILCFLVSSIWHGLELGLFVCMFGFGLLLALYKVVVSTKLCDIFCKIVPFAVYHPFKFAFFYYMSSYYEICFEMRYLSVFTRIHGTMYHLGTWLPPLIILIALFLPKVRRPRKDATTIKSKEETVNDKDKDKDKKT